MRDDDALARQTRATTVVSGSLSLVIFALGFLVDGRQRDEAPPPVIALGSAQEPRPRDDVTDDAALSLVVRERTPRPRAKVTTTRLARAKKLGARGGDMENPCLLRAGDACERTALDPLFRSLDALVEERAERHASVVVLGNSLIAADHIIDVLRARLTERFGDGGRGFVLADRMAEYGPRTRTGRAQQGAWAAFNFSMGETTRHPFGVAGVLHTSTAKGARTVWTLRGEERARVLWLDHATSPGFRLTVDRGEQRAFAAAKSGRARDAVVELPAGARALTLSADGKELVVYGAVLETSAPGVIVNTFGVPAADAAHFLDADQELFAAQLALLEPSLVVVMLGGNEAKRLHWGRRSRDDVEGSYRELLARVQQIVPTAACLGVGPIDSVYGGEGKSWATRAQLPWVVETQKRVALEQGCAFFDMFAAMGGRGSLKRLADVGLMHDDMVHPRDGGLDLLGELLADALLRAYEITPVVERKAAKRRAVAHEHGSANNSGG